MALLTSRLEKDLQKSLYNFNFSTKYADGDAFKKFYEGQVVRNLNILKNTPSGIPAAVWGVEVEASDGVHEHCRDKYYTP